MPELNHTQPEDSDRSHPPQEVGAVRRAFQRHPIIYGLIATILSAGFWGYIGSVFGRWGSSKSGNGTVQKIFATTFGLAGAAIAWEASHRASEPVLPSKDVGKESNLPESESVSSTHRVMGASHEGVIQKAVQKDHVLE